MIIRNPKKVDLSDTIIRITWKATETIGRHELHGIEIYHSGEYDMPISLADVKRLYPKAELVISDDALSGKIYRYGNHGEFWEEVGETRGYA